MNFVASMKEAKEEIVERIKKLVEKLNEQYKGGGGRTSNN